MALQLRTTPHTAHGTQFVHGLRGACTLSALAGALIASKGQGAYILGKAGNGDPMSAENLAALTWQLYLDAHGHKDCADNGGMDQEQVIRTAGRAGLPVLDTLYFRDPMPRSAWVDFLRKHCGGDKPNPVLVQFAAGRNLKDAFAGTSDQWNLDFHAATCYGTQTDAEKPGAGGYVFQDGDNPIIPTRCAVYPIWTLEAAQPVSMTAFSFVPYEVPAPKPPPIIVPPAPKVYVFSAPQWATIHSALASIQAVIDAAKTE